MTYQLANVIRFEDIDQQIIRESNDGLFSAMDFGIYPDNSRSHTALYNGYLTKYTCSNKALCLSELHIIYNPSQEDFLQIGNARPCIGYSEFMQGSGLIYENIGLKSSYSGGLLVGKISTRNLPFYINFTCCYLYLVLWELVFDNGNLVARIDYSDKMSGIREKVETLPPNASEEWFELIEQERTGYVFDYFPHWSNKSKAT